MRTKNLLKSIAILILLAVACDEPELVVTNIVHRDGSITRVVEMKNSSGNFRTTSLQVPVDSTWTITDSVAVGEKGDTTWFRRAEKLFSSAGELNLAYRNDSSYNKKLTRSTEFRRKFKWFNTTYTFSEKIGKTMSNGYPLSRFMNSEQLEWYYSPEPLNEKRIHGADSLKYRTLQDSVHSREEFWLMNSICAEFIAEIGTLIEKNNPGTDVPARLGESEQSIIEFFQKEIKLEADEAWLADSVLNKFVGPGAAEKYKSEADSAVNIVVDKVLADFKEYSVRIVMPGRLVRMNGFVDSSHLTSWPVRSEFFLTEDYVMEAESVMANVWAWIVSALFVVFVVTGVAMRKKRRLRTPGLP